MPLSPSINLFYAPDNASLVVRLVLEAIGLEYTTTLVDRSQQEQRSEKYLQLNPTGLIPACVIDGQVMFETAAIILHLSDRFNRDYTQLHIIADIDRSAYLTWLLFVSNHIHTQLRPLFYPEQYALAGLEPNDGHRSMCVNRLQVSLQILNDAHSINTHRYLFSDKPSVVDIYLAVCCRWMQLYPADTAPHVELSNYPRISSILDQLSKEKFVASACQKEGIVSPEFIQPLYANPTEGSAT